ncbi:nickel ABC transporter substrate-binding protein [Deltaproteobacteria bacterium Smac51]|nr:nickel ABC transporter substrate-binding protein [Deltaproteobacteria bacterium Smac51]
MLRKIHLLFFAVILSIAASPLALAAPKPDALVMSIAKEQEEGYDPTTGWGRNGIPLFQSTLLAYDENLNVVGDLATEYTLGEDRTVWNLKLRQDVKFTDGRPLTAEDVVYTFQAASASTALIDLSVMESVAAKGEYEVEFKLKTPQITFINHLIRMGIVPKHLHGPGYARRPVGSGPFKFVEWNEGQQLIAERNEDYYGQKPDFQRLVFLFMSEDAAFAAAKAGQLHVVAVPHGLARQDIPGMTLRRVKSVDNRGILFPMLPDSGLKSTNGFPIGNDVSSDPAIRQAINYGMNREALVDGILYGHGSVAYGLVDGLPWDNKEIRFQDNDQAKARQILKDGGWLDADHDGIVEKNGRKASMELIYPASDQTRQRLALIVADQIRPIGIELKPMGVPWDAIYNQYHFNSPVLYGWGDTTPEELFKVYHSRTYDNAPDSTSFNPGRYSNPAVDRYLEEAEKAPGFEESLPLWRKAQWDGQTGPAVHGDAAWAWMVNLDHNYSTVNDLDIGQSAIEPHGHGWPLLNNIVKWKWTGQ